MARRDYSEDDDFYSQGFEKRGVVSVWVELKDHGAEKNIDTLQDLCGVGYYRLSDQESNSFNDEFAYLPDLLPALSYSASYINEVVAAAQNKGIHKARRIVVQYDFAYDPAVIVREIDKNALFLGVFCYTV